MGLFSSATDKLFKAAGAGDAAAVARYAARGADVNACNVYARTPLTVAVFRPDDETRVLATVTMLLARGADVNVCDGNGNSALIFASWKGYARVVEKLLAAGALLDLVNTEGYSALIRASSVGHIAIVRQLLDAGAIVDRAGPGGKTPLHFAATKGHSEIAQLLLAAGADPLVVSDNGRSSIASAERASHPRVANLLRTSSSSRSHSNSLHRSASSSRSSSFQSTLSLTDSMLANAAPVVPLVASAPEAEEDGKLHNNRVVALVVAQGEEEPTLDQDVLQAADAGDLGGVFRSLARGADVNARNDAGATPLMLACRVGHGDVVETLLMAEPELDAVDHEGNTALLYAATTGHAGIVSVLLVAGVNLHCANHRGETAATAAVVHGHVEIVRELVGNDASLSESPRPSLLHCAATSDKADMTHVLRYLLNDCHMDPNAVDPLHGVSPLQAAVALDHQTAVDCFLRHGAIVDPATYKTAISPSMQATLLSHNHALYNAQCVTLLHAAEPPTIQALTPLVPLITSVYDMRWLLTLVELCPCDALHADNRAALLLAACDHVMAMMLVFDTSACAYFKLMLESVDKSEWLPHLQVIELDRMAENINTESAEWVSELKRTIEQNAWRLDAHEQCLRQVVDGVREVHAMVVENRRAVQTTMSQLEIVQSQVLAARQLHAQLARNTSQVVEQLHHRLELCEDNVVHVASSLQSFQHAIVERQHHEERNRKIKMLCSVVASIAGFVLAPVVKEIADAVVDLANPLQIVQYVYGETDIAKFLAEKSSKHLPVQVQKQLAAFAITTDEFEMLLKEEIALAHPEYLGECKAHDWAIGDLDGGRADTARAVQPTLEKQSAVVLEITAELRVALRVVEASGGATQEKWRSPSMDMDDATLKTSYHAAKNPQGDLPAPQDVEDEAAAGATNHRELVVFVDDADAFPFHAAVLNCHGDLAVFKQAMDSIADADPITAMRIRLCAVASWRESLCAAQYAYCLGFRAVGDLLSSRMDPRPVFSTTAAAMAVELVAAEKTDPDEVPYIAFVHESQGDAAMCEHYLALVDEDDCPLEATVEADVVRVVHSSSVAWSAVQYASHLGFVEIVKLLIQRHGKQLPVKERMQLLNHALAQRSSGRVAAHAG